MEKPYAISSSYGSFCFEDNDIIVESIVDELPTLKTDTVERIGGEGSVLRSAHLTERNITLECRVFKDTWQDFDRLKDQLAGMLLQSARRLSLRNHVGEYYEAKLMGIVESERQGGTGIGALTLSFTAFDPVRFGQTKVISVGTSSQTVAISGTYPASIEMEATGVRPDSSTGLWGIRFDEGDFLHVKMSTGSTHTVVIDCYTRTVRVDGVTKIVTLDSNWPVLDAGVHTARIDLGTGTATVSWQERNV